MRSSFALFLVFSCGLLACKGNESKPGDNTGSSGTTGTQPTLPGGDPFEKGLGDLEELRSKMCACANVPCTEQVFEEFKRWRSEIRKQNPGQRPTREQEQKGNVIDRAMKACRANVTAKPGSAASAGSGADLIEAALVQLDSFKSKMCACKDKACADAVQTDYATWQRNLRSKVAEKPNAQQDVRGKALDNEMKECRKKAETATQGAPNATSKVDNMLAQTQSFRDKLCACTSKDCTTKLQREMHTWIEQVAKDLADAKPTKDQDAKGVRLQAEIKTCIDKLR